MHSGEITVLLEKLRAGDRSAEHRLYELVYPQLHEIAGRFMRKERAGDTLQTTALVHEAFLRISDLEALRNPRDRSHLLGFAGCVMRNILVDRARARNAGRRGGPYLVELPIDSLQVFDSNWSAEDVLMLNEALEALAAEDERSAKALEGHFFGGLTIDEVADWLDVAPRTIKRDLSYAKAWIRKRLTGK
jgi:RNA polymerase sigma factor (TIGR02999 family)